MAVLVLRWFINGDRVKDLARDNEISRSTAYSYLHEGIDVLADQAPDLHTALNRAAEANLTHVNLDGTLIATDRCRALGPTEGVDLWWSGKHHRHGGNIQVLSTPDGYPLWVSPVRPGREHDISCARTHHLTDLLDRLEALAATPTLTDLGYIAAGTGFRHPIKKPTDRALYLHEDAYNRLIRAIHAPAERANSLLKTTFKALRHVSLDPWAISRITRAALTLLHWTAGRTT